MSYSFGITLTYHVDHVIISCVSEPNRKNIYFFAVCYNHTLNLFHCGYILKRSVLNFVCAFHVLRLCRDSVAFAHTHILKFGLCRSTVCKQATFSCYFFSETDQRTLYANFYVLIHNCDRNAFPHSHLWMNETDFFLDASRWDEKN